MLLGATTLSTTTSIGRRAQEPPGSRPRPTVATPLRSHASPWPRPLAFATVNYTPLSAKFFCPSLPILPLLWGWGWTHLPCSPTPFSIPPLAKFCPLAHLPASPTLSDCTLPSVGTPSLSAASIHAPACSQDLSSSPSWASWPMSPKGPLLMWQPQVSTTRRRARTPGGAGGRLTALAFQSVFVSSPPWLTGTEVTMCH